MKITQSQVRIVIVVLALLLIALGSVQALFHVQLDESTQRTIGNVLFIAAAIAFGYLFKLRKEEREARKKAELDRLSGRSDREG